MEKDNIVDKVIKKTLLPYGFNNWDENSQIGVRKAIKTAFKIGREKSCPEHSGIIMEWCSKCVNDIAKTREKAIIIKIGKYKDKKGNIFIKKAEWQKFK